MPLETVSFAVDDVAGPTEESRRGTWREDWMTSPRERAVLVALLNLIGAKRVIEFGVNEGWTAACLLENVPTIEHYLGIDVPPLFVTVLPEQRGEVPDQAGSVAAADPRFEALVVPRGSASLTTERLGTADAAFIDGDHSFGGVAVDTALARACVRPDGLIIWHDYGHASAVTRFLDGHFGRDPAVHVEGTWIAYEVKTS
jgi:predicted O-methyltransferase YrrM